MPAILWTSDPHLDHASDLARARYRDRLRGGIGTVLVSTGDTSVNSHLIADLEFLADAAERPLYFVLGNHDHYGKFVAAVRDSVLALAERRAEIQWLPPAGVVSLDADTALVGVDGWADGRHGDPLTTRFVLYDDRFIGEIATQQTRPARLAVKRALADADASRLRVLLDRAMTTARTIVIATHVPPFPEGLPTSGRLATWLVAAPGLRRDRKRDPHDGRLKSRPPVPRAFGTHPRGNGRTDGAEPAIGRRGGAIRRTAVRTIEV